MLRLAPLLVLTSSLVGTSAFAQSLPDYLRMRAQHKVTQASTPDTLDSVIGSKVFEIDGVVKGSFKVGDRTSLLVERGDGKAQVVETLAVPDWLVGNEVPARLLIRATRKDQISPLRVVLIGSAPRTEVAKIDASAKSVEQAKNKRVTAAKPAPAKVASRSGAILRGAITRNGTRLTSRGSKREWTLPASKVTPIYAARIKKINPKLPNAEALRIAKAIVGFSMQYGVDARLVMAIIVVESGFNPQSVSRAGAMGLGQLMPGTAEWMGVSDPFDTTQNIYGSVKLLRQHLSKYYQQTRGDSLEAHIRALAAYNAGEGAVQRHGGVPPYRETQRYIEKVLAQYRQFRGY